MLNHAMLLLQDSMIHQTTSVFVCGHSISSHMASKITAGIINAQTWAACPSRNSKRLLTNKTIGEN